MLKKYVIEDTIMRTTEVVVEYEKNKPFFFCVIHRI